MNLNILIFKFSNYIIFKFITALVFSYICKNGLDYEYTSNKKKID